MPTRSQIDRAGERLRKAETPSESDRELYNDYRASFVQPLSEVVATLRALAGGMPVTDRLKRFETTIQKLRRQRTRLSSIEDIAGCRVVLPTWREQHELLDRVRQEFEVVRERDYQLEPRHGYRALHAVVHVREQPVEIQLRTELEDRWANFVDQLAQEDLVIKYGGGPSETQLLLAATSGILREYDVIKMLRHRIINAWSTLHGVQSEVAELERALDELCQQAPALEAGRAEGTSEDELIAKEAPTIVVRDGPSVQAILDGEQEYVGNVRRLLERMATDSEARQRSRGTGNS